MKGLEFPLVGTKIPGPIIKYDLANVAVRKKYFEAKVSSQIDQRIQQVLKRETKLERIEIPVVQF